MLNRYRQFYDATKEQPYFTKWRNDTMTTAKKHTTKHTTKPAVESPAEQEQEQEAMQELITELEGGEGAEPDGNLVDDEFDGESGEGSEPDGLEDVGDPLCDDAENDD